MSGRTGTHETLQRDEEVIGPSNRSFGTVFAVLFLIVGLVPLWNGRPLRAWALAVSALFVASALFAPGVLGPLNRVWLHLGLAMHRVVNPVVMGLIFYGAVTPFGLVMRVLGKGLGRRLRPDPSAQTYWVSRAGQPPSRMDQQF
jgi:hypothetical protein